MISKKFDVKYEDTYFIYHIKQVYKDNFGAKIVPLKYLIQLDIHKTKKN